MPRYDDSPSGHRSGGHSPLDRRGSDRRIKSPLNDRRRRDSPLSSSMRAINSRDNYDDYRPVKDHSSHHRSSESNSSSMPYKILCVSNISNKFSDNAVRDSLSREFQRFGEPNVKLVYDENTRLAYIYFRNYDDARDARHAKSRLVLFDKTIIIDPIYDRAMQIPRRRSISPDYQRGSMRGAPPSPPIPRRPPPPPMRNSMNDKMYIPQSHRDNYRDMHNMRNDYHHSGGSTGGGSGGNRQQHRESKKEKFPNYLHHIPPEEDDKATRTLFIGNLEVTITDADLRRIFERYGVVEDIDVKRPPPGQGNAYAFIKFLNLDMAHRAKVEMSGQYIGKFQCKIGYGKATPTTRIWVGGLGPWTSLSHLGKEFDRFGAIRKIDFVKGDNHAYIQYDSIDAAQAACQEMRGFPLGGHDKRLRIDYADPGPYSFISPSRSGNANSGSADQFPGNSSRRDEPGEEWAPTHNSKFQPNSGDFNDFDRNASQPRGRDFSDETKRDRGDFQPGSGNNANWDQWWGEGSQFSPNSDRKPKRPRTPDGEPDRKRQRRPSASPNAGDDRISSPRRSRGGDSIGRGSPNYETNGKDDIVKVTINENVTSIPELAKCCPSAWVGGLILKNSAFPSRMLFCSGDLQLVDLLMKDSNTEQTQTLRITQRLRLEKTKLDDVTRRMNIAGNSGFCLLLTTGSGSTALSQAANQLAEDGSAVQQRPLRNLVSYLKQKDAAGVISLTSGKEGKEVDSKGVLYLFPPCSYALELLQRVAPNLTGDTTTKEDYLVVVVVRGTN